MVRILSSLNPASPRKLDVTKTAPAPAPTTLEGKLKTDSSYGSQVGAEQVAGVKKIAGSVSRGADLMSAGIKEGGLKGTGKVLTGVAESGLGTVAGAAQTVLAPVTPLISKLVSTVGNAIDFKDSPVGKAITTVAPKLDAFAKAHPDASTIVSDLVNDLTLAVGGEVGAPLKGALTKDTLKTAVGQVTKDVTETIPKAINTGISKVKGKLVTSPEDKAIQAVTPKTSDLTPTEYEKLLSQKKVTPKTTTKPSEYILSDTEKVTAKKYQSLLQDKDPVKNSTNLINEISSKDKQVGDFLEKNNGAFNGGELKNFVTGKLKDISDVTIPEARITKLKNQIITNFIDGIKTKNMKSLWEARKAFDKQIESAFSGSPTLQNQIKKEFRNAVQDFIAERTPDNTYKGFMKDMTELFNLQDTVATKAIKEKGKNALQVWIKNNPTKAKIIGYTTGGIVGEKLLKATTGIGF